MPLTEDELRAIEARAEAATPGPWKATRSLPAEGADVWWLTAGQGNGEVELGSLQGGYPHERFERRSANAAFIAAARADVPALAAALREAQARALAAEKAAGEMRAALTKIGGECLTRQTGRTEGEALDAIAQLVDCTLDPATLRKIIADEKARAALAEGGAANG
mgnify:CR=1 FL=1